MEWLIAWVVVTLLLLVVFGWVDKESTRRDGGGLLVDTRGRYSLSQLQLVLWMLLGLSLIATLFVVRALNHADALGFSIPAELLVAMGVSLGGAALSTAIKAAK
jgi:hypothetical protein